MNRNLAPSVADILFLVIAPLTAITRTARLTHSDGDLAAHIRMGEVILDSRTIPTHSLASITAANDALVAHAWLSEVIFAALFSMGGLAAITAVTGILVGATHGAVALFLRHKGIDARWALAAALVSLAVSSTHWLARPHMFSIAGVALTVFLLESPSRRRILFFAILYLLWANLHGGWIFGLLLMSAWSVGCVIESVLTPDDRQEWRARARSGLVSFGVAAAVTFVNPYGFRLHEEVMRGATSADLARQMAEFLPPDFQTAAPLPFLLAMLLTVALLALSPRRMSAPHLVILALTLFLALRSFRHMALFGVSAWPLVALHAGKTWPVHRWRLRLFGEIARLDASTRVGLYAVPVAALLLIAGLNGGTIGGTRLIRESFIAERFPVAAIERARASNLDGPIFHPWEWGGYIMYAWPGARLVVDPLKFNDATVTAFSTIDGVKPGWRDELARWKVRTVIIPPDSRLAETLRKDTGWTVWHHDSTALVFRTATN